MSNFSNLVNVISKSAPILANAIVPGAGNIINLISDMFGVPRGDSDALANTIANNPEAAVKLQEIESNMQVQLQRIIAEKDIAEVNAWQKDNESARNMQVQTRSYIPSILAMLVTFGFFGLIWRLCSGDVPTENSHALDIMLGSLAASYGAVIGYYYGTSRDSNDKDKMIFNSKPVVKK